MTLLHFWVTQPPSPQLCPIWTFKGSNWGFLGAPDPTALCKELSRVTQPIPPLLCPIWTFQGSNWGFLGAPNPTALCKQLSGVTQPIPPQLWPIWTFQGSNWGFLGGTPIAEVQGPRTPKVANHKLKKLLIALFCPATRAPPASTSAEAAKKSEKIEDDRKKNIYWSEFLVELKLKEE
jgi:hypothetical protein